MMKAVRINTISGKTADLSAEALASLNAGLRGEIITAEHEQYAAACMVWNGLIAKKPGVLVRCQDVADVIAAVRFAGEHSLRVSVRGGGHNVAGACLADDGFVIDLSAMRSVRVDPQRRVARVAGGARLGDLDQETQVFGLAAPVGVVSATGVAGLTLHGGTGWLLRKHGLAIDNLLAVEVVTADGRLRRADQRQHEDLFWAIRGGGGNFGVVTSFEFQLHPVGPQVWFSVPMYPLDRAPEVMAAFRKIMGESPDELMAIGVYWSAPAVPEVPVQYHGAPVVILLSCYTGPFEQGEKAIAPLRTIGTPIADLSGPMRWLEVQKFLDGDYPDGGMYYWKSIFLDRLDEQVIDTLSRHAAGRPSSLSSIDIWTLGRAMGRVSETATAFYKRDAPYMIGIEANWTAAEDSDANIDWARKLYQDLREYTRGGEYLNFPGFFENRENQLAGAYGANLPRLQAVKATYDPENLFAGAVNIQPA
ncbi:MAG: FAD-binding oxidoreductase [Thermodesulfobacteriota bacterium]